MRQHSTHEARITTVHRQNPHLGWHVVVILSPVPGFDGIDSFQAILIPAQNGLEVAAIIGVANHATEFRPLQSLGPADPVVFVPANDAIAFALSALDDFSLLVNRVIFPLIGAHADVAYRGLCGCHEFCPFARYDSGVATLPPRKHTLTSG